MSQIFQEDMLVDLNVNIQGNEVEDELFDILQLVDETGNNGGLGSLETPEAAANGGDNLDIEYEQIMEWLFELDQNLPVTAEQNSDQGGNVNSSILAAENPSVEITGDSKTTNVLEVTLEDSETDNDILEIPVNNAKTSLVSNSTGVPDESDDSEPEIIEIPVVDTKTPASTSLKRVLSSDEDITAVCGEADAGVDTKDEHKVTGKTQETQKKKVRIIYFCGTSSDEEEEDETVTPTRNTKSANAGKRRSPRFQNKLPAKPKPSTEQGNTEAGRKSRRQPTRRSPRFVNHG